MKIYNSNEKFDISGTCIALGDFDGVHRGHRKIFEVAAKTKWGVLLFDRNTKNKPLLTTMEQKLDIIKNLGADYVCIAEFNDEFKSKTPQEFVEFIANHLKVKSVVVGFDYHFGYRASGNAELLKELCCGYNINVEIISAITDSGVPIKSTEIRYLIEKGKIKEANGLLGYCYTLVGTVEMGLRNGHILGFPTANIDFSSEKLLPMDGVYCGRISGRYCVVNVGKNPTFSAEKRTVEAHIIDYYGDLYGNKLTLEFLEKIRNDIHFDNLDALKCQINNDIKWVKEKYYE